MTNEFLFHLNAFNKAIEEENFADRKTAWENIKRITRKKKENFQETTEQVLAYC